MLAKKTLFVLVAALLLVLLTSSAALAGNPAGTGQPGTPTVSCGEITGGLNATLEPPGLLTDAFLNIATQVYAGTPGTPSYLNANSPAAVSQYDVACYQYTQHQK